MALIKGADFFLGAAEFYGHYGGIILQGKLVTLAEGQINAGKFPPGGFLAILNKGSRRMLWYLYVNQSMPKTTRVLGGKLTNKIFSYLNFSQQSTFGTS